MQRLTKTTKIISVAILTVGLAAGAAFAGPAYQTSGQYAVAPPNNVSAGTFSVLDINTASGDVKGAGPAYQTSGQYVVAAPGGDTYVLDIPTASGAVKTSSSKTGVICDLNNQYFYDNYYNQLYDCSYCDWSK